MSVFTSPSIDRDEVSDVFPIKDGALKKKVRLLSAITVDDIMENAVKVQAHRVKVSRGPAPTYGRDITDYLLKKGRD